MAVHFYKKPALEDPSEKLIAAHVAYDYSEKLIAWHTFGCIQWEYSRSPLPEQEPQGTLYINIISYMISYLISYPISGIISIGYMYISFLRTYTAPVAEWHI